MKENLEKMQGLTSSKKKEKKSVYYKRIALFIVLKVNHHIQKNHC